ncbi:hypothetical protein [Bradyrhizobium cosmicum]|uniref:hypothetical protein n=1 Tax=Bradyrhizobium cosmicum TaxID=1404864 RepID=UPI0028EEE4D2|nr:hypothetical protein [Bradyrhizobium cosmicum]
MPIDRNDARALVEAGYMPLSEYIKLFGETDTAPDLVPAIVEKRQPRKKSHIVSSIRKKPAPSP